MQKKGILIVSFGTSHVSTRQKTIGAVEETIRRAVALGGDCDTIAAIAGSIAEGRSPVPQMIREKALRLLPEDLRRIVVDFAEAFPLRHLP